MTETIKLDSHHRVTADRIFRHPMSRNIQWHDVTSLLESLGECRETTHGSYEFKADGVIQIFPGPLGRDLSEQHVSDMRKVLRRAGITPETIKVL